MSTFVVGSFALTLALVLVGCAREGPAGSLSPMVEDGSVARATIVSSESCSRAMLLALPEYCAWPEGARRTMILERNVVIIAHVEEDGKPVGVRILGNAGDPEIDAAITECAMHGRYRPASDHTESLTCPVRIRLARFPTDLGGRTASLP